VGAGQQLEKVPEVLKCIGPGRALASASLSALPHVVEPWTTRHSGEAKKSNRE
jgi:hypothetical protein